MKGKAMQRGKGRQVARTNGLVLATMVFGSGFAGLVYQLLWMKQLSLLFGNTAQAASATLAAFFAGLGAGSWWWGRRSGRVERPLRLYARLELGIALTAMVYFVLLKLFAALYPPLYAGFSGSGWLLALKFLLALLLVFPPAFFMGGTVPVIGQVVIHGKERFGGTAAVLYGVNTLGAALGVLLAAFVLIPSLGFRITYSLAVLLSLWIGGIAWKLSCDEPAGPAEAAKGEVEGSDGSLDNHRWRRLLVDGLCFFSGFVVLAHEVAWTRIFAQAHENSVYAFAIVLVVVLVGLALGAGISGVLARFSQQPMRLLGMMAVAGGCLLVIGPSLIMHVTHDLTPVSSFESWGAHVRRLFKMGFGGIGYAVIALGMVFPFLMKVVENEVRVPGRMLGRLLAVNTLGAIAGALLCGFAMLPMLGIWGTLKLLMVIYLVMALLIPVGWRGWSLVGRLAALIFLLLSFTALDPSVLPKVGMLPDQRESRLLEVFDGSDCTVAVTETNDGYRAIVVNGSYTLGSTAAYIEQVNQARIPLFLFPDTGSICFIGLGTGMSAGAALDECFPEVRRVVSCELSARVVEAARKWMPPEMLGGLFVDPRSTVLIEDGRHYLMATDQRFDMINADLFLTYRRGAGSLYSLDHYKVVAERLNPGGVFVQWLPLYQLTEYEFGVISRTMLEVFGEVTMWRNNFMPGLERVALVGRIKPQPLAVHPPVDGDAMRQALEGLQWWETAPDMISVEPESSPFLYAGNLTEARELFDGFPLNTDDRPVIEYETPKRFRQVAAEDKVIFCVGPKLLGWIDRIFEACPLERDPLWAGHPDSARHIVRSGMAFHRTMVSKVVGTQAEVEEQWRVFKSEWLQAAE